MFCFCRSRLLLHTGVDSIWNVIAHGDAREAKRRGNWRMKWVASTLLTTSEHGVSSITTADAHTSAASSRWNWRPRRFKLTRPFRRKTKSGFCACAITFQLASTVQSSASGFLCWRCGRWPTNGRTIYTIIVPTKCTSLLKTQDITICTFLSLYS
jgi:hypothetical protein